MGMGRTGRYIFKRAMAERNYISRSTPVVVLMRKMVIERVKLSPNEHSIQRAFYLSYAHARDSAISKGIILEGCMPKLNQDER